MARGFPPGVRGRGPVKSVPGSKLNPALVRSVNKLRGDGGAALKGRHPLRSSFCVAALGDTSGNGKVGRKMKRQQTAVGIGRVEFGQFKARDLLANLQSKYDAELFALAIPTLFTSLVYPLSASIDAAIVGRIGVAQLSGVGLASIFSTICNTLFTFLAFIGAPTVARAMANGDSDEISKTSAQSIVIAVLMGTVVGTALFFGANSIMTSVVKPSPEVLPFGISYLKTIAFGTPAALCNLALSGVFRGLQDAGSTFTSATITCLVNVILDILFVFGFGWGVVGAGVATVISLYLGQMYLTAELFFKGHLAAKHLTNLPDLSILLTYLLQGAVLITRSIFGFGMFLMGSILVGRLGVLQSAAFEISRQLALLLLNSYMSLEMSTQALCAKYLGSKDIANARGILQRTFQVGVTSSLAVGALACTFCRPLVGLFTSDPLVANEVMSIRMILFLCLPADAIAGILDGALISSGQNNYAAAALIVSSSVAMVCMIHYWRTGMLSFFTTWVFVKMGFTGRLAISSYRIFLSKKSPFKSGDRALQ